MSEIEVPKGWKIEQLQYVCEKITSGGTPSRNNSEYYGGDIPWLKIGDLNNKIILNSEEKITKSGFENSSAKLFPKNTVLIAMYGATIGKTGILGINATTNQAICGMICGKNLLPQYLHYFLKSKYDFIRKLAEGGAQPNINQDKIKNLKISIPSLETQKKIVAKLDHILNQLEEKKKQIISRIEKFDAKKINQNYKNHLLNLAFDGTLTNEHPGEIIDGIHVPKGWKISTIGKTTVIKGSTSKLPNNDLRGKKIHFIKVSDMNLEPNSKYIYETVLHIKTENSKVMENSIPPGSVIIPKRGGAILTNKKRITTEFSLLDPNVLAIIPNPLFNSEYLYYYFLNTDLKQFVGGEIIPQLNKYNIESLSILIPPIETQKKIVQILDKKFADWENHKQELENIQKRHESIKKHLSDLSSSILNDAFSGKLVN